MSYKFLKLFKSDFSLHINGRMRIRIRQNNTDPDPHHCSAWVSCVIKLLCCRWPDGFPGWWPARERAALPHQHARPLHARAQQAGGGVGEIRMRSPAEEEKREAFAQLRTRMRSINWVWCTFCNYFYKKSTVRFRDHQCSMHPNVRIMKYVKWF